MLIEQTGRPAALVADGSSAATGQSIAGTGFFPGPDFFDILKQNILPEIARGYWIGEPLRTWMLGCATGEEAYALAIAIAEFALDQGMELPAMIFASDISEHAIAKARKGIFSQESVTGLSSERLRRFFIEHDDGYEAVRQIREMCVFDRQNPVSDPPFSRLDLAICRGLAINEEPALQLRLIPLLHYSLKPDGFLWLSEDIASFGGFGELFDTAITEHKVFRRRPGTYNGPLGLIAPPRNSQDYIPSRAAPAGASLLHMIREADRAAIARYSPPGALLNAKFEVIKFRGDVSPYLDWQGGPSSKSIVEIAREELRGAIKSSLEEAGGQSGGVRREGLRIGASPRPRVVNLEVVPLLSAGEQIFLLLFQDCSGANIDSALPPLADTTDREVKRLRQELARTREYMNRLIERDKTVNSEWQTVSEELEIANQELRSLNEELQTSKEELQSSNEELIRTNDELRTRNEQLDLLRTDLSNLIGSSEMAMITLDRRLRIRNFSPKAAELLHIIDADIGRSIGDFRFPIKVTDLQQRLAQAIRNLKVEESEVQDRQGRWYSLRIHPYRTSDDKIDGAVILLVDVQSQKDTEEQIRAGQEKLREVDRRKDEFLATLAHELRNPLAPLSTTLEILRRTDKEPETKRRHDLIDRQLGKLKRLVDDLLDVSRISSGRIELRREPIDLRTAVQRAVESVQQQSAAVRQRLSLSLSADPVWVEGDPVRLEQIIGNLLNNSVKYTNPGGQIMLRVELARPPENGAAQAVLRVRDSGIGIAPERLDQVFELFVRGDSSYARRDDGLGVGLSLVKRLTELHGGTVTAYSEGPGKGSEFVVRLPACLQPVVNTEKFQEQDGSRWPAASPFARRILVVDDKVDAAESLAELLESFGHELRIALNGPQALEIAATFRPEIVLLDIGMPGMDGYEVARRLRQLGGLKEIRLVALTGYGSGQDRRLAAEAGFDAHLVKPIDVQALKQTLNGGLN